MESLINFVNKFECKILPRDDIAGRLLLFHHLKEKIKESKNYFNVTDLCSPIDTLILKKEKSQELKNILAQGNKIHVIAQNWLKQHKDYFGSEAILDGQLIGIPARGRIDGRIGESIVEIKSIKELPKTAEEIIEKYPQYLEQVAFYSVIDPLTPKINYLVFITQKSPYLIKSFKLSILDLEAITRVLKKRIYLVKEILNNKKEAEILGKCRYCYPENCNLKKEEKCSLMDLPSLKCEVKDYVTLVEDSNFTLELEKLKKRFGENFNLYSAYSLLCPRKYCLEQIYGSLKEEQKDFKNSACKIYFSNLIYQFRKSENSFEEKSESKINEFELNKYNWFRDISSLSPEGKKTPFITVVTDYLNFDKPHNYKLAELGLYLMAHGLNRGMIFTYYPQKDKIKVFEITFNFEGDYMSKIREIITGLKNPEKFLSLPKCPDYMCKDCDYKRFCLTENLQKQ